MEEGLCGGAVLYHAHVARSKAQVSAQQAAKDEAAKLKAQRRRQQEDNVRRKEVRPGQGARVCVCHEGHLQHNNSSTISHCITSLLHKAYVMV